MQTCAQYAANAVQNVTQNRENKKLTKQDFVNICQLWSLSFPLKGIRMFSSLVYVQGTGNDKCKVMWFCNAELTKTAARWKHDNTTYTEGGTISVGGSVSTLWGGYGHGGHKIKTECISTELFSDLHIKEGEIKIVLETQLHCDGSIDNMNKETMGFHFLRASYKNYNCAYIPQHVIFTPKPEIFDPNSPPQ